MTISEKRMLLFGVSMFVAGMGFGMVVLAIITKIASVS
jgi:hypothetical protein